MSEKRVVSRRIFVVLGIVTVILTACLAVAAVSYSWQINGKDNTISSQNSQISNLQSQVDDLNSTLSLGKSTIWVEDVIVTLNIKSRSSTWTFSPNYAGYVSVIVQSSVSNGTYVQVTYSAYGANYDNTVDISSRGTAVFPILPTSTTEIRIGNSNFINGIAETVSIVYYY
jgi:predicted PurR-regulated permease PerM